ncbi:MAG: division/cell wall cluster transcriptional repressor MraZ [Deltaproteobacteria bacterium]|jgi:MraZ protein|nr:MAG: division/cell wall cluster transcriptional repressor MraZ [Deltaproteobacteria bacterium]
MFRGRSIHTLDAKGRIRIPTRFRDILKTRYEDRFVITNLDRCLVAYPLQEWEIIEEKLGSLSLVRQDVKAFQRFFISGATECNFDKQGRILIPQTLREHASLDREVVLAGMLRSFEVWSKELWDSEIKRAHDNFAEITATLAELGI